MVKSYRPLHVGWIHKRARIGGPRNESNQLALIVENGVARRRDEVLAGRIRVGDDARHAACDARKVFAEVEKVAYRSKGPSDARVLIDTYEQVVCGAAIIHRHQHVAIRRGRTIARSHHEQRRIKIGSGHRETLVIAKCTQPASGQERLVAFVCAIGPGGAPYT